jgi:hypothetical protein
MNMAMLIISSPWYKQSSITTQPSLPRPVEELLGESGAGLDRSAVSACGVSSEASSRRHRLRSNATKSSSAIHYTEWRNVMRWEGSCFVVYRSLRLLFHFTLLGTNKVSLFRKNPPSNRTGVEPFLYWWGDTFTWHSSHRQ